MILRLSYTVLLCRCIPNAQPFKTSASQCCTGEQAEQRGLGDSHVHSPRSVCTARLAKPPITPRLQAARTFARLAPAASGEWPGRAGRACTLRGLWPACCCVASLTSPSCLCSLYPNSCTATGQTTTAASNCCSGYSADAQAPFTCACVKKGDSIPAGRTAAQACCAGVESGTTPGQCGCLEAGQTVPVSPDDMTLCVSVCKVRQGTGCAVCEFAARPVLCCGAGRHRRRQRMLLRRDGSGVQRVRE